MSRYLSNYSYYRNLFECIYMQIYILYIYILHMKTNLQESWLRHLCAMWNQDRNVPVLIKFCFSWFFPDKRKLCLHNFTRGSKTHWYKMSVCVCIHWSFVFISSVYRHSTSSQVFSYPSSYPSTGPALTQRLRSTSTPNVHMVSSTITVDSCQMEVMINQTFFKTGFKMHVFDNNALSSPCKLHMCESVIMVTLC